MPTLGPSPSCDVQCNGAPEPQHEQVQVQMDLRDLIHLLSQFELMCGVGMCAIRQ